MWRHDLHPVEHRLQVVADHRVDVVVGDLEQSAADASTHVVDPHVDTTEFRDGFVEDALHVAALRHVGDDSKCLVTAALTHFVQLRDATRGQHHRSATSRELLGGGRSDTPDRPGDDDDLVGQISVAHAVLLTSRRALTIGRTGHFERSQRSGLNSGSGRARSRRACEEMCRSRARERVHTSRTPPASCGR